MRRRQDPDQLTLTRGMTKLLYTLVMLLAPLGIANAATPRGFEFVQGVIVDPLHSVGYMSNAEGGIDAVNLSNGSIIANSPETTKPLLLYDDVLLAAARVGNDALAVVGLSAQALSPIFKLEFPVSSRSKNSSFYVGAHILKDEIIVYWRSIQRPIRAILTAEPAVVKSGFARINPTTRRLIAAAEGEPPEPTTSQSEIASPLRKLVNGGRLASPLCFIDNIVVALQYVEQDGKNLLVLRRWLRRSGRSLPSTSLLGHDYSFRSFSRDCHHLMLSKATDGFTWRIYSTKDARAIGEVHNQLPGPEFFILGSHLIYQSPAAGEETGRGVIIHPARLVAIGFDDGRELWTRPIGEASHVEPAPGSPPVTPGDLPITTK